MPQVISLSFNHKNYIAHRPHPICISSIRIDTSIVKFTEHHSCVLSVIPYDTDIFGCVRDLDSQMKNSICQRHVLCTWSPHIISGLHSDALAVWCCKSLWRWVEFLNACTLGKTHNAGKCLCPLCVLLLGDDKWLKSSVHKIRVWMTP